MHLYKFVRYMLFNRLGLWTAMRLFVSEVCCSTQAALCCIPHVLPRMTEYQSRFRSSLQPQLRSFVDATSQQHTCTTTNACCRVAPATIQQLAVVPNVASPVSTVATCWQPYCSHSSVKQQATRKHLCKGEIIVKDCLPIYARSSKL